MNKTGQRGPRDGGIDTEDRVMETVARVSRWMQENRRVTTLALVAVVAAVAAGFVYLNYRSDLRERAAVRLDEIRLSSRNMTPAQLRTQLTTYVDQFGSTHQADEARLLLAEMQLDQDSVARAVQLLQPVVDLDAHPIGYNAGWMMAVAEEQRGDPEAAARWYERLADAARHDYQRRRARAARARLYEYAGDYAAAEEILADLAAEDDGVDDADFYGVQLGEVRARTETDEPPPSVPVLVEPTESAPEAAADEAAGASDGTEASAEAGDDGATGDGDTP